LDAGAQAANIIMDCKKEGIHIIITITIIPCFSFIATYPASWKMAAAASSA